MLQAHRRKRVYATICLDLERARLLELKTLACGGVWYCSPDVRAWIDGHRLRCARLRARRGGSYA